MKLIVGLGNPGKKYAKTRHNVGFRVIDALKNEISSKDVIILKPLTFMNKSGKAVVKLISNFQLPISNLIVVHDDIDLPFGTIRINKNSSSAGHKGVQSIIDELGTQNFVRIRIGIRQDTITKKQDTNEFVLKKFSKQEEKQLKEIIKKAVFEITQLL